MHVGMPKKKRKQIGVGLWEERHAGEAMHRLAESQVQMGLVGSSIWVMSPNKKNKNKKTQ